MEARQAAGLDRNRQEFSMERDCGEPQVVSGRIGAEAHDVLEDTLALRFVAASDSVKDLDIGVGAPFSFGPSDHQASHKGWGLQLEVNGNWSTHYRLLTNREL